MIARIVTWAVEKRWLVLLLTVIVAAIGAALIAASGLYTACRERVRRRQALLQTTAPPV